MQTTVVNIHKAPYDVYCGRAGKGKDGYFGNPFKMVQGMDRATVISLFREYFYGRLEKDPEYKQRILQLKGKRLGCFCAPKTCHCDVYVEYLENLK